MLALLPIFLLGCLVGGLCVPGFWQCWDHPGPLSLSCLSPELSSSGSSGWSSSGLCFCLLVHLCHFLSPWISRGGVWTCPYALGHLSSQAGISLSLSSAFPVHLGPFYVRWLFFSCVSSAFTPIFLELCDQVSFPFWPPS